MLPTPSLAVPKNRPFFIELAGTPRSGKTTCAEYLESLLRRSGFKTRLVAEAAASSPLREVREVDFNLWTVSTTLAECLELVDSEYHFVIVDRGLLDALFWMRWHRTSGGQLSNQDEETIRAFLTMKRWGRIHDLAFILRSSPSVAIQRENQGFLTRRPGPIMNATTLRQFERAVDSALSALPSDFPREVIDTSQMRVSDTVAALARISLVLYTNSLALDQKVTAGQSSRRVAG